MNGFFSVFQIEFTHWLNPCSDQVHRKNGDNTIDLDDCNTVSQSICTYYFSLSGRLDIVLGSGTLKKGPKYGLQKASSLFE